MSDTCFKQRSVWSSVAVHCKQQHNADRIVPNFTLADLVRNVNVRTPSRVAEPATVLTL